MTMDKNRETDKTADSRHNWKQELTRNLQSIIRRESQATHSRGSFNHLWLWFAKQSSGPLKFHSPPSGLLLEIRFNNRLKLILSTCLNIFADLCSAQQSFSHFAYLRKQPPPFQILSENIPFLLYPFRVCFPEINGQYNTQVYSMHSVIFTGFKLPLTISCVHSICENISITLVSNISTKQLQIAILL